MSTVNILAPRRHLCAILCFFLVAACDQAPKSEPATENIDSMPVKKMGTDSNSDMPVAAPQDSTVQIPNAYEPEKK